MWRATWKSLLARKLRLVLSGLAVLLGVMFVSGSFVLTDALGRSFDNLFASSFAHADVLVTAEPAIEVSELEGESVPGLLSAADRDVVAAVPGVARAIGEVQADGARVIGADGKVVTTFGPPRFGENWTGEIGGLELREGRAPAADDEIVVNAALAATAGIKVGDQVGVLTTQPKRMFTLVGIFGYAGGLDSQGPVTEVRFHEPVAQELMLGEPGAYTSLTVLATGGTDPVQLRDAIAAALGEGYVVQTSAEAAAAIAGDFKEALAFFNNILLGFAGVALFVGSFLILNTFSIIVAQRTKELALNRALGASRKQIIGSVLLEALVIGTVAAVLGLAAGVGVGALLADLFAGFSSISLAGIGVPSAAVISAFAVGIVITMVAAIIPALRSARVPPVAALREAATPDRPLTRLSVSGAVIVALGAGLTTFGVAQTETWPLLGGVLAVFIGVSLLSPALARPASSLLGRLLSWSVPGRLGRLNSGRNPRRTAITAAALMIGIALVTGISTIVTSSERSIRDSTLDAITADLIIAGQASPGAQPAFPAELVDRVAAIPGVGSVAAVYADQALIEGDPGFVYSPTDMSALARLLGLTVESGTVQQLAPNDVVVRSGTASELGLSVGDSVTLALPRGEPAEFEVAGIVSDAPLLGRWLAGSAAIDGMRSAQPTEAYVGLAAGADAALVRQQLEALLADSPEMLVQGRDAYLDQQLGEAGEVLTMIQILLGLAILIAVLGVINTLALSVLERTRELGLLRAIGFSRSAVMRMITTEAVVITTFGALLGLVVGAGLGAAVVRGLADDGLGAVVLPWQQMGWYLVLGAAIGVVAAVLPAIRGARTNVLQAISYE